MHWLGGEARDSLAAAVKSGKIESLKDSIQEGVAAGLEEKELSRAKDVLAEEERKVAVRLGLCAAVDANNVDALRVTIKEGLAAGLGSEDLEEAMEALERKVAWGPLTCIRMLAHDPRPSSPRPSSPRPGIRGPRGGYGGSGAQDGLGAPDLHPHDCS